MSESISIEDILEAAAFVRHSKEQRGKGPARKTHCVNGHDLSVHGEQKWKINEAGEQVKNGRFCVECKREKQRTGPARPNAQKPRRPGHNPHAEDYVGRAGS